MFWHKDEREKQKIQIHENVKIYKEEQYTGNTDISDVPGFISVVVDRHNSNQSVGVVMLWQGEL